jgi:hemoglobin-like flavoprotein
MPTHTNAPLTPNHRARVRDTLESLGPQIQSVALLFYGRLFELDPPARRLFHIDLAVQARKIMDTLDAIAQSLEQFDVLSERLAELGRTHASYGVTPDQYESVTSALMWALAQALGPDFDRPTREAWALTLAHVCDAMRRGAPSHS